MQERKWLGLNRILVILTSVFSVVFLVLLALSGIAYSNVTLAQQRIVLENPERIAEVKGNGSLFIGFAVRISNPTGFHIHVSSINWYSQLRNGSKDPIHLADNYTAENVGLIILPRAHTDLSLGWYVSSATLAQVKGFINYSASIGESYTLSTVPYEHSFVFKGWLDDYKHDYYRENYLNGLVTVSLEYSYGVGEGT